MFTKNTLVVIAVLAAIILFGITPRGVMAEPSGPQGGGQIPNPASCELNVEDFVPQDYIQVRQYVADLADVPLERVLALIDYCYRPDGSIYKSIYIGGEILGRSVNPEWKTFSMKIPYGLRVDTYMRDGASCSGHFEYPFHVGENLYLTCESGTLTGEFSGNVVFNDHILPLDPGQDPITPEQAAILIGGKAENWTPCGTHCWEFNSLSKLPKSLTAPTWGWTKLGSGPLDRGKSALALTATFKTRMSVYLPSIVTSPCGVTQTFTLESDTPDVLTTVGTHLQIEVEGIVFYLSQGHWRLNSPAVQEVREYAAGCSKEDVRSIIDQHAADSNLRVATQEEVNAFYTRVP